MAQQQAAPLPPEPCGDTSPVAMWSVRLGASPASPRPTQVRYEVPACAGCLLWRFVRRLLVVLILLSPIVWLAWRDDPLQPRLKYQPPGPSDRKLTLPELLEVLALFGLLTFLALRLWRDPLLAVANGARNQFDFLDRDYARAFAAANADPAAAPTTAGADTAASSADAATDGA